MHIKVDHQYHKIELIGIYNTKLVLAQGFKYKAHCENQIHYNCNDLQDQYATVGALIFTKISFIQKSYNYAVHLVKIKLTTGVLTVRQAC